MGEPIILVMAAGMGSRYGGLKQIEPVDESGRIIMDYSMHDAYKAGFRKAVIVIKKENEEIFRKVVGERLSSYMDVSYAFQDLFDLPDGYTVPEGRVKQWGTAHAVYASRHLIDGPFAVINADDFYGAAAYRILYDFLVNQEDDDKYRFIMAGYRLGNTMSEHGYVSRGECITDRNGQLLSITERTHIVDTFMVPKEKRTKAMMKAGAAYLEEETWKPIALDTTVSMNVWGFSVGFMEALEDAVCAFLEGKAKRDPIGAEMYLPAVVDQLVKENKASVKVKMTPDRWFGVTYQEDRPRFMEAVRALDYQFDME